MHDAKTFKPRRGRPNAQQVAAIEATILASAKRMLLDVGFDATSMDAIAADSGVSKGTIYARYPSKDALIDEVVRSSVAAWSLASSKGDAALTGDIGERLHHHGRVIANWLHDTEVLAFRNLLLAQPDRFSGLAITMYNTGYRHIRDILIRDIEAAGARDDRQPRDPGGVASGMVAAITGWHLNESLVRAVSAQETELFAARVVDLLLAARAAW